MKKKVTAFLLAVAMLLTVMLPMRAYGASSLTVSVGGEIVDRVALPVNEKVALSASGAGGYQWQIRVSGDLWVDISGANSSVLELSYGMVASMLSGGTATIRCRSTDTEEVAYSSDIAVTVDYDAVPEFEQAQPLDRSNLVVSQAQSMGSPVITGGEEKPVETQAPEVTTEPAASLEELTARVEAAKVKAEETAAALQTAQQELDDAKTVLDEATAAYEAALDAAQTPAVQSEVAETPAQPIPETTSQETVQPTVSETQSAAEETVQPTEAAVVLTANVETSAPEENPAVAAAKTALDQATVAYNAAKAAFDAAYANDQQAQQEWKDAQAALEAAQSDVPEIVNRPALLPAAPVPISDGLETFVIEIKYQFEDGAQAAPSWTASVAKGSSYQNTVISPNVLGYAPDMPQVDLNYTDIQKNETVTVTYHPAQVNFTVKHYQQNLNDDNYTLFESETKNGYTESPVGENLKKEYAGFVGLLYDTETKIAADGSTEVEIYYDRLYYLMTFDLDGGYGVEPIYARFGSPVQVGDPTKPGYTFTGWTPAVPSAMPAGGGTYHANWSAGNANYTVVFWYENANDTNYSYAGSLIRSGNAGESVSSGTFRNTDFTGRDSKHFTYNSNKEETVTIAGDGSTVLNVYFTRNVYTLTFKGSRTTYGTITAKYQADIAAQWPVPGQKMDGGTTSVPRNLYYWKFTNANGESVNQASKIFTMTADLCKSGGITFNAQTEDRLTEYTVNYWLESLDGTGTQYQGTVYQKSDLYSQKAMYTSGLDGWLYKQIDGFKGVYDEAEREKNNTFNLYYKRNRNTITFYDGYGKLVAKIDDVMYEMPLKNVPYNNAPIANIKPNYPDGLEPGAYTFGGWYTTEDCVPGTEADFVNGTMPNKPLVFYAKWVPITHDVTFYMDDSMSQLVDKVTVPHGSHVPDDKVPTVENGKYQFVGWFYKVDGVEKAFDPENMPVNRDLELYAKWSSNTLVEYTIHYQLKNGTTIAEDTTGSALAGSTKTFEAKAGEQLMENYRQGYFPETNSHSLTMNIEGSNEFTFYYVQKEKVPYTVKYLEKGTGKELADEKHEETPNAVITENFVPVKGYMPDAYQKRLVLSANEEENVIIFWYTKDDVHAPVQITHYIQNVEGDGYTVYQDTTDLNGEIGKEYSTDVLFIDGFTFDHATANDDQVNDKDGKVVGTVTEEGLHLELYYNRNLYPYEFRFLEQGTEKQLQLPVTGSARYQAQVTRNALEIPGYTCISEESLAINIQKEESSSAVKNVKIFYYSEQEVTITYVPVGPDGVENFGSVNPNENKVKVFTGNAEGAEATAADGFRFAGWFKDKACTEPVEAEWVRDNHVTPAKTKNYGDEENPNMGYEEMTIYAKFEQDSADLTITASGAADIDENQAFIFKVEVTPTSGAAPFTFKVAVPNDESKTIRNLPAGTYTVTEIGGWSWRYGNVDSQTPELKLVDGRMKATANFDFSNARENNQWLNGSAIGGSCLK